jgi:hypothetical protein
VAEKETLCCALLLESRVLKMPMSELTFQA